MPYPLVTHVYSASKREKQKVTLSRELDIRHDDGREYYCINPQTKRPIHVGVRKTHNGEFVLVREEEIPGKSKSESWRYAKFVTDAEMFDWIVFSGKSELLDTHKFFRLKKYLMPGEGSINNLWPEEYRQQKAMWTNEESTEIKRRLKYIENKQKIKKQRPREIQIVGNRNARNSNSGTTI